MIDITAFEKATHLRRPRRIRKYVLVWCCSGTATLMVDENEFELKANTVITITSGQVHWAKKHAAKGFVLEFTYDFFCKDDQDIELIFHNSLFCHFAMNETVFLGKSQLVESQLRQIEKELKNKPYQYLISVHSMIKLILVEINRAKIRGGDEIYRPDTKNCLSKRRPVNWDLRTPFTSPISLRSRQKSRQNSIGKGSLPEFYMFFAGSSIPRNSGTPDLCIK